MLRDEQEMCVIQPYITLTKSVVEEPNPETRYQKFSAIYPERNSAGPRTLTAQIPPSIRHDRHLRRYAILAAKTLGCHPAPVAALSVRHGVCTCAREASSAICGGGRNAGLNWAVKLSAEVAGSRGRLVVGAGNDL